MSTNVGTKRQRIDDASTGSDTHRITDLLPVGCLVNISEYLHQPSKAILAAAIMTTNPLISNAIVSASTTTQWHTLDFGDIEKILVEKLVDDDLANILTCINAKEAIRTIKLTYCMNIKGHGLNPLSGSTVLEKIDLSLARQRNLSDHINPRISEKAVLPILDSILDAHGSVLKQVLFPAKWHRTFNEDFLSRLNRSLIERELDCSRCERGMNTSWYWSTGIRSNRHLAQNAHLSCCICYDCNKHYCHPCTSSPHWAIDTCCYCKKSYCSGVDSGCERARKWGTCQWCQGWDSKFCEECEVLCNGCGGTICADCMHTCECCGARRCDECDPEILKCDNCNATNCEACFNEDNYSVRYCEECDRTLCSSCRVGDCKKDGRGC